MYNIYKYINIAILFDHNQKLRPKCGISRQPSKMAFLKSDFKCSS